MEYLPYNQRKRDSQYRNMLRRIKLGGTMAGQTRQGVDAVTLIQQTSRYDLANGFPLITERDLSKFWWRGVGELCAFINGITDLKGLESYGVTWWPEWMRRGLTDQLGLPPDTMGKSGYGGAFHDFPTLDGSTFDQYANVVEQIKLRPADRVHFLTPWMPKENSRVVPGYQQNTIAPCHGWVHVRVLGGKLHLHMFQRSGDTPVGVPMNMAQYAALMLMLEHLTGIPAGTFYHTISDAHIYENQLPNVEELIARTPRRLPTVHLSEEGRQVKDIHDFRGEHFVLSDYHPHPAMSNIPVAT